MAAPKSWGWDAFQSAYSCRLAEKKRLRHRNYCDHWYISHLFSFDYYLMDM
jgi:hypothetical protein